MLNKNSCQLGTNLALMLYEQNKDLTPIQGTLVQELAASSYLPIHPDHSMGQDLSGLADYIANSAQGDYATSGNRSTYAGSKHDALMDNYIETISKLVTNHVQYARTVVYPKVQYLAEQVSLALKGHEVQQPEDFFEVHLYALPEVFQTELVANEVVQFDSGSAVIHVMNFGDAVHGTFDLAAYVATGESDEDTLIQAWMQSVGYDKLSSYLFAPQSHMTAALPLHELIESSFVNFLFYRSLAFRQDLGAGLSVIQLVTRASDNRDYFARALKAALQTYHLQVKQGVILAANSSTAFSYLSNKRFAITIYEESFRKAAEEGATLEQVFGYISQHANVTLNTGMLKAEGARYAAAWNTVRGLYLAHIASHRDSALKMALKLKVTEAIYQDLSEEDTAFFQENQGFEEETAQMVCRYVDNLDSGALERTKDIYIDLIAGIAYRHSSAARIIREMVTLLDQDESMGPAQAALYSTVKYVTDFLIEEVTVSA